jgi:Domain of unknown function (DUF4232)
MSRVGLALVGCAAVLAAVAAGCGGQNPGGSAEPTGTLATSSTPPTTVPVTGSATPPPATSSECTVADLQISLGVSEGTAGTTYRALVFTNSSGRMCTIQGFPGVSFVAGDDGHQVGQAAVRVGEKGPIITLIAGGTATAPVGFVNIGAFDQADCQPTPVRGLRVYPPHDTASEFVAFETMACAGTSPNHLTVRTVHPGSDLD